MRAITHVPSVFIKSISTDSEAEVCVSWDGMQVYDKGRASGQTIHIDLFVEDMVGAGEEVDKILRDIREETMMVDRMIDAKIAFLALAKLEHIRRRGGSSGVA